MLRTEILFAENQNLPHYVDLKLKTIQTSIPEVLLSFHKSFEAWTTDYASLQFDFIQF